jgi:hypothetical protein
MQYHVMGSTKGSNSQEWIGSWRISLSARRILLEGGLLLALVACGSWLVRW